MSNIWEVKKPTAHMRKLCKGLGKSYRILPIDLERVIYRDFGNGYDLEISGVNTSSLRKTAVLYLWKGKKRIVKIVCRVPQEDIDVWAEWLRRKSESFTPEDFNEHGFLKNEKRMVDAEMESYLISR